MLLLLFLLQGVGPALDAWKSDDPAEREKATTALLDRWKEVTDADLATLDGAGKGSDAEVARRATAVAERVRVRRKVEPLLGRVREIESRLIDGGQEERMAVVAEVLELWGHDALFPEEATPFAELLVSRAWPLDAGKILDAIRNVRADAFKPFVKAMFRHEEPAVRSSAAYTAEQLGDPDYVADALALIDDAKAPDRTSAVTIVVEQGGLKHAARLAELTRHDDSGIRRTAVAGLGNLGARDFLPQVLAALKDDDVEVQLGAIDAVARLGTVQQLDAIRPFLESTEALLRDSAVHALAHLGASAEEIETLARSTIVDVRVSAILHMGPLQAAAFLKDAAPLGRRAAMQRLVALQAKAQAAEIAVLFTDPDEEVRYGALQAVIDLKASDQARTIVKAMSRFSPVLARMAIDALVAWGAREVAPDLAKLLEEKKLPVRGFVVEALTRLDPVPYLDQYVRLLRDDLPEVRAQAFNALSHNRANAPAGVRALLEETDSERRAEALWFQKSPDDLLPALKDTDARVRREAVKLLAVARTDSVAPLLQDSDPDVRTAAIVAVTNAGRRQHFEAIVKMAGEEAPAVRAAVASSIGDFGVTERLDLLRTLLKDPVLQVRAAALWSIVALDDARDVDRILAIFRDTKDALRMDALQALGAMRAAGAADEVLPLLDDPEPRIRRDAIGILEQMGAVEHAPAIAALLNDPFEEVRCGAIDALGTLGDRSEAVERQLARRFRYTRARAVDALARIDPRRYEATFVALLKDRDVANAAIRALARLGDSRHAAEISPLLDEPALAEQAARALGRLGAGDAARAKLRAANSMAARQALLELGELKADSDLLTAGLNAAETDLEPVLAALEPSALAKLRQVHELKRPIATVEEAARVLGAAGLKVECEGRPSYASRIAAGTRRSGLELLVELLDRRETFFTIEGDTIRVMARVPARQLWRKRLPPK